jgi:hypothetical protein
MKSKAKKNITPEKTITIVSDEQKNNVKKEVKEKEKKEVVMTTSQDVAKIASKLDSLCDTHKLEKTFLVKNLSKAMGSSIAKSIYDELLAE